MSSSTSDTGRDLEREYNPRIQVPEYASYFARWKDSAQEVRRTLDVRLDLRYGLLPAERLDYFPAAGSGNPLLIFVHGGYWRTLDKNDFSWVAPPYVACGVSVAVINYGLLPGTPLFLVSRNRPLTAVNSTIANAPKAAARLNRKL